MVLETVQALQAGGQGFEHAAGIVFTADIDDLLARVQDLVGTGQLALLVFQLFQFAILQAEVVQFVQLVGQ